MKNVSRLHHVKTPDETVTLCQCFVISYQLFTMSKQGISAIDS